MLTSPIFEILATSEKASQIALESQNRVYGLQFAVVTNNVDPLKLRRIRVTTESKGGLVETDWLMAMRLIPNYDPPIPLVGTSVLIAWVDGDPHDGIWLGPVINRTNPQDDEQADPVNDSTQLTPGKLKATVQGEEFRRTEENLTIECGKQITIRNDAGASLTLHESGALILTDAWQNRLVLGGQTGGLGEPTDITWNILTGNIRLNLNGNDLEVINADGVSINTKQVTTIGAVDSRGDNLVTRGW